MALEFLTDLDLPVVERRVVAEKVADYVDVTGDDPERWASVAPPSYAGALLFAAAPELLGHPDVVPYTTVLVHLDQTFRWHGALPVDTGVQLRGDVSRVRSRSGAYFVTYELNVLSGSDVVIESTSTFLLGDAPASDVPEERQEPPVRLRSESDLPEPYDPAEGVPTLQKSASRHDLVRYAAASGDFNPIHFDHGAARGAGLQGIVCHGLLTTAWVAQLAGSATQGAVPIRELAVRYRDPVYPADSVVVAGEAREPTGGTRRLDLTVSVGDRMAISGRAVVQEG